MKWFKGITSVQDLRTEYKKLLLKHHPDNGGEVSVMQEINTEYDSLFDRLKAEKKEYGECSTHDEKEENKAFKEILYVIIGYKMEIVIIGSWVWTFHCFAYKDRLKELGFKYAPKKKAWCWHYGDYKRYHKAEVSLDDIRAKYGSQKVTSQSKQAVIS